MSIKIFISYAHADRDLHERLVKHLFPLVHYGKVTVWRDLEIPPGADWEKQIRMQLDTADLILLLVSADFIASKYCWNEEVRTALERHKARTARVVPIILKPVHWQGTPLGQLQALPPGAKPVTQWADPDAAFVEVMKGILRVLDNELVLPDQSGTLAYADPRTRMRLKSLLLLGGTLLVGCLVILLVLNMTNIYLQKSGSTSGGSPTTISATPSPTTSLASSALPRLKSLYSGEETCTQGCPSNTPDALQIAIDAQDQSGNITARWIYPNRNTNPCTGKVTKDKHFTLTCTSSYQDYVFHIEGAIYPDGHLEGTNHVESPTHGNFDSSWTAS